VDLAAQTTSDYATVMFSGATGGATAYQAIRNFHLRYDAPVAVADERLMVGGTEIPAGVSQTITFDTPAVIAPAFLITDGIFGDDSALRLVSQTGGALRYANTVFDGATTVDVPTGLTLTLQNISSGPYTFTKQGGGDLALAGSGNDATLNLDSGHADLSGLATGSGTQFNLSGGATVTSATPKSIIGGATVNGKKIPNGIYTPINAPTWVASGQVNIGAVGTIILLR